MNTHDWLMNLPMPTADDVCRVIEVSFSQGSRKDFFRNGTLQHFEKGDLIAVEGVAGFDVGDVSLTGEIVRLQMKKKGVDEFNPEMKKVLRKLEEGENFVDCARRELYEETGIRAGIEGAWWARVEPWRAPDDPELYAGVGFLARHPGGEIEPETAAHDAYTWATETEWRSLRTWYTEQESDVLWRAIREMRR